MRWSFLWLATTWINWLISPSLWSIFIHSYIIYIIRHVHIIYTLCIYYILYIYSTSCPATLIISIHPSNIYIYIYIYYMPVLSCQFNNIYPSNATWINCCWRERENNKYIDEQKNQIWWVLYDAYIQTYMHCIRLLSLPQRGSITDQFVHDKSIACWWHRPMPYMMRVTSSRSIGW